ncbi:putative aspartic endopeptidase pep1 protein [Lasiodiplodia theobromae]|uniref:Aspartic endopeptidase pep1 protein n=1 Tax=Lasiodiplodia theobromae TaxID=45133 RepID=A0A8H7MAZ7_9PEZI|nr:putative aspartic endopeptidase pep1 protein [Lasiodiplodia theobromae]
MSLFKTAAACATILSLAAATPIDKPGKTFTCKQVEKGFVARNGPAEMLKAFNKFSKDAPSEVVSAAVAAKTGSAAAVPGDKYDTEYLTPVTIGNTTLQLQIDTGSSDLWVYSSFMPESIKADHSVYDPAVSGIKMDGYSWNITYGDESAASGSVYADKVVVGDLTATSQAVGAATSVSNMFVEDPTEDGILGLGFIAKSRVQPKPQKTFFDNIADHLAEKLFAVTLKRGEAGTFDFGFRNRSKYTGRIAYVDVDNSDGRWEFASTGYAVGKGSVVSTAINAIADTGSTLLSLPGAVVKAYYNEVNGSFYSAQDGGFVFPCNADLPEFTLIIGGRPRTVPGEYMNYSPANESHCYGGLQKNTGLPFSIIGSIFLKSQYVVFDQCTRNPRLGFAQQA